MLTTNSTTSLKQTPTTPTHTRIFAQVVYVQIRVIRTCWMQRNSRMPQAWRSNATPKSLELNRSGNSLRHVCHQPWLTLDAVRPSQLREAKHRAKKECKNGLGCFSHKILVKWYQSVCILYLYEVQSREDVEIVLQSGQDETNKWRDQQTTPFCRTKMNKQRREMQKETSEIRNKRWSNSHSFRYLAPQIRLADNVVCDGCGTVARRVYMRSAASTDFMVAHILYT